MEGWHNQDGSSKKLGNWGYMLVKSEETTSSVELKSVLAMGLIIFKMCVLKRVLYWQLVEHLWTNTLTI